jgi:hypothetical protein
VGNPTISTSAKKKKKELYGKSRYCRTGAQNAKTLTRVVRQKSQESGWQKGSKGPKSKANTEESTRLDGVVNSDDEHRRIRSKGPRGLAEQRTWHKDGLGTDYAPLAISMRPAL